MHKPRAPRNRTIWISSEESIVYGRSLKYISQPADIESLRNQTVNGDLFEIVDFLPRSSVDLLFLDPPYNLTKNFNETVFRRRGDEEYGQWMDGWFARLMPLLKATASVYICCDWRCSSTVFDVARRYLSVRNRITWEREKGRGANANWKNCSEDIWFCTMSERYTFNSDAVKLKRRVIAPYRDPSGLPKDWSRTHKGDFRITCPSNLWTDLTVPFWSMPENTDHPTQKPEKLLAKIILASSNSGDLVLDPFLGSGTTSVVAKKLGRAYVGIEVDKTYCLVAEKRLTLAEKVPAIQGLRDGLFWERNSGPERQPSSRAGTFSTELPLLQDLESSFND